MRIKIIDAAIERDLSEGKPYDVLEVSPRFDGYWVTIKDDHGDLQDLWSGIENFEEVE